MDLSGVKTNRALQFILLVSGLAVALLFWVIYVKEPPADSENFLPFLPALNCVLNGCSTVCLIFGFVAIKRRRYKLHMRWMMGAFLCSAVFLVSYLLHHYFHGDTRFPKDNSLRGVYLLVLFSHIVLSVVALPMIFMTFFYSLSGRLELHRRLARFTFPIWLYVSVTGVVVYFFLKWAHA